MEKAEKLGIKVVATFENKEEVPEEILEVLNEPVEDLVRKAIEKRGGIRKIFSKIYGKVEQKYKDYPEGYVIIGVKDLGDVKVGYFPERRKGFKIFSPINLPSWLKEEMYEREYAKIS